MYVCIYLHVCVYSEGFGSTDRDVALDVGALGGARHGQDTVRVDRHGHVDCDLAPPPLRTTDLHQISVCRPLIYAGDCQNPATFGANQGKWKR